MRCLIPELLIIPAVFQNGICQKLYHKATQSFKGSHTKGFDLDLYFLSVIPFVSGIRLWKYPLILSLIHEIPACAGICYFRTTGITSPLAKQNRVTSNSDKVAV